MMHFSTFFVRFFGSPASLVTNGVITVGLILFGVFSHFPLLSEYWVGVMLYYSILAIFVTDIVLMEQKRVDQESQDRATAHYQLSQELNRRFNDSQR
jgi:uncharacterized membrane protein